MIAAIISVTSSIASSKTRSPDLVAKVKRMEWAGAVSLILTVFILLFALDRGGNICSVLGRQSYHLLAGHFPNLFVCFAFKEMKLASEPFTPKRIIVNRTRIASHIWSISSGLPQVSLDFLLSRISTSRVRRNRFSGCSMAVGFFYLVLLSVAWSCILSIDCHVMFRTGSGHRYCELVYGHHYHIVHWFGSRQVFFPWTCEWYNRLLCFPIGIMISTLWVMASPPCTFDS